jgi:D-tyrosyl-tRNA(Tyr) deacylase
MKVVLQRVSRASVSVGGQTVGAIGRGYLLLVGIGRDDTEADLVWMADKLRGLRVFEDDSGKMNLSIEEADGAILSVSQFTLYGDCRKGRRPSFTEAAPPDMALAMYERFNEMLRERGLKVETGRFGAMMEVSLVNDGPVTFILDSRA